MKTISILGITGSIGTSVLKILKEFPEDFHLRAVSAHSNIAELIQIVKGFKPDFAVCTDSSLFFKEFNSYSTTIDGIDIIATPEALQKITYDTNNDCIVNAISGLAGVEPSLQILEAGIDLALANKESIVCAGPLIQKIVQSNGATIIPIDSEHSAILSLLRNYEKYEVDSIYLTASGGPFFKLPKNQWENINLKEALAHPTWEMGEKITIDSASMANKGFEVIEAHYLFNLEYDAIKVLIHPQSLIHSLIETIDGELYAQIGPKDMAIPIMNALFYPELKLNSFNRFSFSSIVELTLQKVDFKHFPMLQLAYDAGALGGYATAFYNAINDELVGLVLQEKMPFYKIEYYAQKIFDRCRNDFLKEETITLDGLRFIFLKAQELVREALC